MEYVEILAMILNSDDKVTKEYYSAIKGINTQFFIDKSMISDTPTYKSTGNGFISIYEDQGEIVLDYLFNGTGNIKSCTKKVRFEFNNNLMSELSDLKYDRLTDDIGDDVFDYSQFCAACTMYHLKRDSVDLNHVTETPKYSVDYYLRKLKNNEYFLQADLVFVKPVVRNNVSLYKVNLIFDIDANSQKRLQQYTLASNLDNYNDKHNQFDGDDYDNEYQDYDNEFCENPFDSLSNLGPGSYDLENGTFTPDNDEIYTDEEDDYDINPWNY